MAMKDVFYSFELWYSALKSIEGYFGSSVATYFKFLRLLFICNVLVCIPMLALLIIPQIIHGSSAPSDVSLNSRCGPNSNLSPPDSSSVFYVQHLFTGEVSELYFSLKK